MQAHPVADDDVLGSLREPWQCLDAELTQTDQEVVLAGGGYRRCAHALLKDLPVGAFVSLPVRGTQVCCGVCARAARVLTGLDDVQAVLVLDPVGGPHRPWLVLPAVPACAVLAHDVGHDVDVVAAGLRRSMMDRDPPARSLAVLAGEAHLVHEVVGDHPPSLVALRSLLGLERQGAVPDMTGHLFLDDLTLV